MSVPYFNYSFDSETVNSTIILNNIVSHDIPVTDGLYMRFEGKNYDEKTKTWYDSGGAGRHIPPSSITGTPTIAIQGNSTNGTYSRSFQVLKGTTAEFINFGNPRLEQYTFFHIARYGGATKQRIFTCTGSPNWLAGFYAGYTGVAHHTTWITASTSTFYGTDFFVGCDCSNSYRTNGIERFTTNGTITYLPNITVNGYSGEKSDFEIADVIIYNRYLSLDERIQMENYLASIYGITFSQNLLPVTTNLYMRFEAKNYNASTKTWTDTGGSNRHITSESVGGTPSVVTAPANANGATNKSFLVVKGGTGESIVLGNAQLTNYTLFFIARYGGGTRGRIFTTANGTNWLSGFWSAITGVAYHVGWITQDSNDLHGTDFFISTDCQNSYRSNGVERAIATSTTTTLPVIKINGWTTQLSDFEIAEIIIYSSVLTLDQRITVENYLASIYGITISAVTTSNYVTPISQLPPCRLGKNGVTFACWFRSQNSQTAATYPRIFDFGISANKCVALFIEGAVGKIGLYIPDLFSNADGALGNTLILSNGPYVLDNVWRHVAWTISPDGTQKVYINGALNYTTTRFFYPQNYDFTTNYIGKSNANDIFFNGAIDEFKFYKSTLTADEVYNLYDHNNTYPTITPTTTIPTPYLYYNFDPSGSMAGNMGTYVLNKGTPNQTVSPNTRFAQNYQWTTCENCPIVWTASGSSFMPSSTVIGGRTTIYEPFRIFDGSSNGGWVTAANKYNLQTSTIGDYKGSPTITTTTTNPSVGTINGEWLQIQSSMPLQMLSYRFDSYYDNSNALACALPQTYYILGSNNGTTWDPIQYVVNNYASSNDASSNVNYTNTYTITNNTVATTSGNYDSIGFTTIQGFSTSLNYYSYFRLVVNKVFGKRLGYTNIQSTITGATNDFLAIGDWIIKFYPQYYYDAVLGSSGLLQQSDYRIPNNQVVTNARAEQYVRLPTFSTDISGITFTCWFRSNNNGTWARLFEFANSLLNESNNNINLFINNSFIGNGIRQYNYNIQNTNIVPEINDNIWRHVAWTINTNGISTLYINGQSVFSQQAIYPYPINLTTNFLLKSVWNPDPSYNGAIDEFAMYKTVLSDTAINTIYDSTKTIYSYYNDGSDNQIASTYVATPDLYYTFDTDTVRYQYLQNKATGIYDTIMSKDTIIDTTDYKIGNGSIALDGLPSTYVQLPKLSATGINGLTFACWFRSNGNFDNTPIFDFGNGLVADNISAKINRNNLTLSVNNGGISPYIYNPYFHYKFNKSDVNNYTLKNYGGGATDISGQYDAFIGVGASTIVDYSTINEQLINPSTFSETTIPWIYGDIYKSGYQSAVIKYQNNLVIMWGFTASSINGSNNPNNAFRKNTSGGPPWVSSTNDYSITTGNYNANTYGIGTQWNTTISGLVDSNNIPILNLSGEWLEIRGSPYLSMSDYRLFSYSGMSESMPRTYYIFGSNNRTTWYPIQYVTRSGGTSSRGFNNVSQVIDGFMDTNGYVTIKYTLNTNTATQTDTTDGVTSTYNGYPTSLNSYTYFRILIRQICGSTTSTSYTSINRWYITFKYSPGTLSTQNTQSESLILTGADNQKITLPAFTSGQDGLTFSFWMRSDSNSGTKNGAKIMDLGNDSKTDNITMSVQNDSLCCDIYNNGISSSVNSVLRMKPVFYYNFDDNTVNSITVANLATGNLTQYGNTFITTTESNNPYPTLANLYNGATVKGKVLTLSRTSTTSSSSQFLKLPTMYLDSTKGLTMGCWFRTTDTGGIYPRLFTLGADSGTTNQIGFGMTNNRKLTVFSQDTTFRSMDPCTEFTVNDGVWRHFIFTINGGASGTVGATWRVYINGVLQNRNVNNYYPTTGNRIYNYVGRSNNSGDSTFDGQISEVFMANTELKPEEVFALYSNNSAFFYGLNDNNWRHYAWTIANNSLYNTPSNVKISNSFNPAITNSTWKLYVNGVLTKTLSNMNFPNNISRIKNYLCGSNTATDPSFNGALDDFRMYKSVLSDADIESIYKNPSFSNMAITSTMKNDNIVSNINDNKWRHLTWSIDASANWKVYMNGDLYSKFTGVYPNSIERYLNFFGKLSKNPDTIDSSYSTFTPNAAVATANTWANNGVTWTSSASSFWQTTYSHNPYRAFNTTTSATSTDYDAWHIADNTYDGYDGLYNRTDYFTYINSIGLVYGEWLQIQTSIPLVMKSYILSSRSGFFNQMPRRYYIVGSNDNSTWYPIQSVTRQVSGTATANTSVSTNTLFVSPGYYSDDNIVSNGITASTHVYGHPTTINTYTYFRMIVTQNSCNVVTPTGDGRYMAIGEWNITFSTNVSKNFAGAIDDFRMYKRTLNDNEVLKIATINPLFFHYRFDQSDVNGQSLANMANGSPIYDASLSTTGLINTTDFKTGNGSLALTTDEQEYPPAPITADTTFIYYGSYGQGRYDVSYSSQYGTATNENANKVFSKAPSDTWTENQWTSSTTSYTSLSSIYSTNNALGHTGTFNTVVSGISISGEWIQLKMPNAIVLNKYMIIGETSRSMNSFVLAGSNDGNTWSLIDEQRNLGVWSLTHPNCTMYFELSNKLLVYPPLNQFFNPDNENDNSFNRTIIDSSYGNGLYKATAIWSGTTTQFSGYGPFYSSLSNNDRYSRGANSFPTSKSIDGITVYGASSTDTRINSYIIGGGEIVGWWFDIELPYQISVEQFSFIPGIKANNIYELVLLGSNNPTAFGVNQYTNITPYWEFVGKANILDKSENTNRVFFNTTNKKRFKIYRIAVTLTHVANNTPYVHGFQFHSYDKTAPYNHFRLIPTSIAATANATTVSHVTIRQIKYFAKPEQYVTLPSFWTGYNGLTFAMWFKLNNVSNISPYLTQFFGFAPSNAGIGNRYDSISLNYNTNSIRPNIFIGSTAYTLPLDLSMNDNVWRHVAWTVDRNGYWKIYINGRLVKSESKAYPSNIQRYINYLGKTSELNTTYNLNGGLDDFRMYKSVLTDQEVMALYKESNKLLIHYTFDKETVNGSSVGDMVGMPAQLTIANGLDFKNTIISPNSTNATTANMNGWTTTHDNRVYNWRASASSLYIDGTWLPHFAFDTGLANTTAFLTNDTQSDNKYSTTTGVYIGLNKTNVQSLGDIGGEWLQINCDVPIVMSSYYLVGRFDRPQQLVRTHYIVGSNDGINWYPLQYSTRTGSITGSGNTGVMWTYTTAVATGSATTPIFNVTPYSYDIVPSNSSSTLVFKLNGYSYANNPYTMFRMIFTEVTNTTTNGVISLFEWQIYAYEPLPSQPIYGSEVTPTTYYSTSNVETGIWANDGVNWTSSSSSNSISLSTANTHTNTCYTTKPFNGRIGAGSNVYQFWSATGGVYTTTNVAVNSYTGIYNTLIQTVGAVLGEYLQINSNIPVQISNYFFTSRIDTTNVNAGRNLPQEYYIVGSLDGSSQWYPIQYVKCNGGSVANVASPQNTDIYYTTTKLGETQTIASKVSGTSGSTIDIYNYPVYALGYYTSFRVVVKNTFGSSYGLTDTGYTGGTVNIGQWNIKFNPHIINPYNYRLGNASLNLRASYGEFLTIPTIKTLGSDGISFSLWFSSDGTQEGSQIMELGNGYNNDNILMYISNGNLYFGINNGNSSNTVSNDTMIATKILDGNWRNIVVLIATDGTWTFYVNGQFVKTVAGVYPTDVPRYINYLGKSSVKLDPYFNGYIDDFRVYRTVLTTTEIAEIYNSTSTSALDANGLTGFEYNGIDFSKLYKRKYTEYAGIISTIAGGGTTRGDGGFATNAGFGAIYDMAIDNSNNYIYFSFINNNYVRRIDASGIITTVVGTGVNNSSGDGGLAINASVNGPSGLALDTSMNLYIAERYGNRIRKIDTTNGTISTIAGTIQPIATTTTDFSSNTVSNWVVNDISFTASLSSTRSALASHKAGNLFIFTDAANVLGIACEDNTYSATTGAYSGKRNTTGLPASMGLTANTLSGDWIQLFSSQPVRMISYNLSQYNFFAGANRTTNLPQSYHILGSNDTVSWYPIQKVDCSYMSVDVSSLCPTFTYNVTTNYGAQQIGPNPSPNSIGYGAYLNYSYADNSYNYFRISFQKTFGQNGGGAGTGAPLGWGNQINIWDGSFIAIGKWAINFQADCVGTAGSYGDGMLANSAAVNNPIDIKLDSSNNIYITEFDGRRIRKIDASSGIITSLLGYISPNSTAATGKNWISNGTRWDASSSSFRTSSGNFPYLAFNNATGTDANTYSSANTTYSSTTGITLGKYTGTVNTPVIFNSVRQIVSGEWLQIHSGTPCQFISHSLSSWTGDTNKVGSGLPASYTIVGSMDASSWYPIQDVSAGWASVDDTTTPGVTQTYVVSTNSSTIRYGTPNTKGDVYLTGYPTAANYYTYFRLIGKEIFNQRFGFVSSGNWTSMFISEWNINFLGGGGYGGAPAATASSTGDLSLNGTIIGGIAGNATINGPIGLAFDTSRNLYVAENSGHRIRKLLTDPSGTISSMSPITTICGNGTSSHTGDGRYAINATIAKPSYLDIDSSNNILLGFDSASVTGGALTRMINGNNGIIDRIAGTGTEGFSGDGGFATNARLSNSYSARFDKNRNIYIGDNTANNNRIRKITRQTAPLSTNLLKYGVDIANTFSPRTGITTAQTIDGITNTNLEDNIEPIEQQAIPAKGRVFTDNNSWVTPVNPVYVSGVSPNSLNATSDTWTTIVGSSTITWNARASSSNNGFDSYEAFNSRVLVSNDAWASTTNRYDTTTGNYTSNTFTYINGIGNVGGEWLQIQTSLPLSMNSYQLNSQINNLNALPKIYYIAGSNDKLTWYPIQYVNKISNYNGIINTSSTYPVDTRTNYIDNKTGDFNETLTSDVTGYPTSNDYYIYFRIITIQNCSSATSQASNTSIGEWTINGTVLTNPTGWQFSASTEDTSMNANAFNAFNNSTTAFWKDICGNYNSNSGSYCDIVSPNSTAATGYSWTANGITWDASASSFRGSTNNNLPYKAFNNVSTGGDTNTFVTNGNASTSNAYNTLATNAGIYTGIVKTNVVGFAQDISGEWLQIKASKPCQYLMHNLQSGAYLATDYLNSFLPARYYIVGSNDGSTWYPIQDISYGYASTPDTGAIAETTQTISMTTNTTPTYYGATGTIGYVSLAGYSTSTNYYTYFRMIIKELFGKRMGYSSNTTDWKQTYIGEWNLTLRQGPSLTSTTFTNTLGNPYSSYSFPVPYKPSTILIPVSNFTAFSISNDATRMVLCSFKNGNTTADYNNSTNINGAGAIFYSTSTNGIDWATPIVIDTTIRGYIGAVITNDGTRIAYCANNSSNVYIYSWPKPGTPTLLQTLTTGSVGHNQMGISRDGNILIFAGNNSSNIFFSLWNNTTNTYSPPRKTLQSGSLSIFCADISKEGNRIVYVNEDSTRANQKVYWATWNGSNFTDGTVISTPVENTIVPRTIKFNEDASVIYLSTGPAGTNAIYMSYFNYATNSYSSFVSTEYIPPYITPPSDQWGITSSHNGKYIYRSGFRDTSRRNFTIFRLELAETNVAEGEWIQVKLPYQLKLTTYSIMNRPTTAEKDDLYNEPRIWWLLGSNDGSAWNLVDYRNDTASIGGTMRVFNSSVKEYYSYYRLVIAATSVTTSVSSATLAQLFLNGIYNYTDSAITAIGTNYGNVEQILPIPGFNPTSNNFTYNGRSFITSSSSQGSSSLTTMSPFNAFRNINSTGYVKDNNSFRWDSGYSGNGFNNAGTTLSYGQDAYDATGIYRGGTSGSTTTNYWRTNFFGGNESNTVAAATMTRNTDITVPRANIIGLSITADNTRVVYCVYNVASQGLYFATINSDGTWSGETSFDTTQRQYLSLSISADGSRGVFCDNANGLYYFTWTGTTYTTPIKIESNYNRNYQHARITYDGNRVVANVGESRAAIYFSVWNGSSFGPLTQTLETRSFSYIGLGLSNDGNRLVYGSNTNDNSNYNNVFYSVWNGTNYTMGKQTLDTSAKTWRNFEFSNDNNILYASTQGNTTATLWISKYNSILDNYEPFIAVPTLTIPASLDAWPFFMSRDGNTLYCKGYNLTTLYRMSTQIYQAAGEWIQVQTSSPLKLSNYRILSRNNDDASVFRFDNSRIPIIFYMLGSNDGTTWFLLDAQSLTTTQTSRELGSYSTSTTYATQYYTYFRLVVNKISGNGSTMSLTNVQLFGVYL